MKKKFIPQFADLTYYCEKTRSMIPYKYETRCETGCMDELKIFIIRDLRFRGLFLFMKGSLRIDNRRQTLVSGILLSSLASASKLTYYFFLSLTVS